LSSWKEDSSPQQVFHQSNRIHTLKERRKKALDIMDLRSQQQQVDRMIAEMIKQIECLNFFLQRHINRHKELWEKKERFEMPVLSDR
jgi:hypothetical protein